MKTIKQKLLILLVLLAGFGVASCDLTGLTDAVDDFSIVIGLEPINTSASVLITDAATGELVTRPLRVQFNGENGDDVIDIYSDPIDEVTVSSGVLNFGIQNDINPTEVNPAEFTLSFFDEQGRYLATSKRLEINETGASSFSIDLVQKSTPPEGVEIKEETAGSTDESGTTENDIVIELSSNSDNSEVETGSSVEVAEGSTLLDQNGQPLTGSLQASAIYYNPAEFKAVEALPAELLENVGDSALTVLGATDLTITDSNGRVATQVGAGASAKTIGNNTGEYILNYILNSTTYNELQRLLRLAYISPTTAERFILYTVPEVSTLPDGRVSLRYVLNSDLFRQAALVYFSEQPGNTNLNFVRNGNSGNLPVRIFERGFVRTAELNAGANVLTLRNVTRGPKTVSVGLEHVSGGSYEETIDLLGESNSTMTLPAPPSNLIDATVNVVLECVNPDERVRVTDIPAATILYRKENAPSGTSWRVATDLTWNYDSSTQSLSGGSFDVQNVEQDESYDFKLTYDNKAEQGSLTITGPVTNYTQEIEQDICR